MRGSSWLLLGCFCLMSVESLGLGNKETTGDCSPIITGDIKAPIKIECGGTDIPALALAKLETYLQENYRSQRNLNDLIDKLREEVANWTQKYHEAIRQNAADLGKHPNDPLLEAEQAALQAGKLEQAAEIRDAYYQRLKREKTTEISQEAYRAAERWEGAFDMTKALERYEEAVQFNPGHRRAWLSINRIARRMGNYALALTAARGLQAQLDPKKDIWWLAVAFAAEGDVLRVFGENRAALTKYRQVRFLLGAHAEAQPGDRNRMRDLSVSHNKVGDMHKANGDNAAALKAYEDGLAIAKKLAELDSRIVEWQTGLVVSYFKLSQIDTDARLSLLTDALGILRRFRRDNLLERAKHVWIGILEAEIGETRHTRNAE